MIDIRDFADLEALSGKAWELLGPLGDEARARAEAFEQAARVYRAILSYVAAAEAAFTGPPEGRAAALLLLATAIREADPRLKPLSVAESLRRFSRTMTPAEAKEN